MCGRHRGRRTVGLVLSSHQVGSEARTPGIGRTIRLGSKHLYPPSHPSASLEQFPRVPGVECLSSWVYVACFSWLVSGYGTREETRAEHFRVHAVTMIHDDVNGDPLWRLCLPASIYCRVTFHTTRFASRP